MTAIVRKSSLHASIRPFAWTRMPDAELLALQVRELDLSIAGAGLQGYVKRLQRDLRRHGLEYFQPRVYFGDEWFCPGGVAAIAVPFYLAHPRLTRLERRYKQRVEGDNPLSFMKLMRHEAGHAFDHAYGVSDMPAWKKIFGDKALPYHPERYRYDASSMDFVLHLDEHYAQSHPEEDFAETFAVYMTPGLDWERQYRNWPVALRKLRFVDQLVQRYRRRQPLKEAIIATETYNASRLRRTLGRHYGITAGKLKYLS